MALSFLRSKVLVRHAKKQFYQNKRNAGYVVLIPEIGEDGEKNTLLGDNGLPEFSDITIEKCIASISKQSLDYENGVRQIEHSAPHCKDVFEEVFTPLEKLDAPLELTWGMAKALYLGNSSLMPTASYRNIHERAHKARSAKFNSVPIFRAAVNEKNKLKKLTDEDQRLLDKYILEGKLNGLEESGVKLEKLYSTVAEIQKQKHTFREKVEAATDMFSCNITDRQIVREFPSSLLAAMAVGGDAARGPWRATLRPHVYEPFMRHCPDRDLRWNAWQAHVQRCSGYGDKDLETSTHLEKIRALRNDQAKLLGFDTFVDMSMETKMAGSAENVLAVLDALLEHARPAQDAELAELQRFASERGFDSKLEHWDVPYWRRKQRRTLHDYDEDKVREYFPLPGVLRGLFELCGELFDVHFRERAAPAWHRDVRFYDVLDGGRRVAGLYLDPYARRGDKPRADAGGWHVALRGRCAEAAADPLSALVFSFRPPTAERPALLAFDEVEALFRKFGHALRHLLTTVDRAEVAGLCNVEWDAAETAGHVLASWLRDAGTLRALGRHHRTGEPLPEPVARGLCDARKHMAGAALCGELYLARLDLELHSKRGFWRDIVKEQWPRHHALPFDKYDSHPLSFTRIVSEEWAAAQYCGLWARMLAADVVGAWAERGDARSVGARYRGTWLARGGAVAPGELFRRFRGRDPSPQALLAELGLVRPAGAAAARE